MKTLYIHASQYLETINGTLRASDISVNTILKSIENKMSIVVSKPRLIKDMIVKKIIMENGEVFYMPFQDAIVFTQDGAKKVRILKKGDYLQFKHVHYLNTKKKSEIIWQDELNTYSTRVRVPKETSHELAFFTGVFATKGVWKGVEVNYTDRAIDGSLEEYSKIMPKSIEFEFGTKEKHILYDLAVAIKACFHITLDVKPPLNLKSTFKLQLNAANVMNWIKAEMNEQRNLRRVPLFIRRAPLSMRLEFLKGLSAGSYLDKSTKVFFAHSSKQLILYAQHILKSLGYGTSITQKKNKGSITYCLNLLFRHRTAVTFPLLKDLFKMEDIKQDYYVLYQNKIMLQSKVNGPIDQYYFLKVKKVQLMKVDMLEVETNNEEGFPINNIVII